MIVYVATFSNGKKYVGATTKTLEVRRSNHRSECASGVKNKFYNAARKYGWYCVEWSIHSLHDTAQDMFAAEIALIKDLDTVRSGYNTATGGQGNPGREVTDESRARMSDSQKRRFQRQDQVSAARKYANGWLESVSPERLRAINERRAETVRKPEVRGRISASLKERFRSVDGAIDALRQQAVKLYEERPEVRVAISRSLGGRPVTAWRDGRPVAVYSTLCEASRATGASIGNIGMVINGKRNHAKGFVFTRESQCAQPQ